MLFSVLMFFNQSEIKMRFNNNVSIYASVCPSVKRECAMTDALQKLTNGKNWQIFSSSMKKLTTGRWKKKQKPKGHWQTPKVRVFVH